MNLYDILWSFLTGFSAENPSRQGTGRVAETSGHLGGLRGRKSPLVVGLINLCYINVGIVYSKKCGYNGILIYGCLWDINLCGYQSIYVAYPKKNDIILL
jgi:hypothetical protein